MTRSWLESHDSVVQVIRQDPDWLVFELDGFIHHWECVDDVWKGTGWIQPIELRMVPLPFESNAMVTLWLQFMNAEEVTVSGTAVSLKANGERRHVEKLSADLAPGAIHGPVL